MENKKENIAEWRIDSVCLAFIRWQLPQIQKGKTERRNYSKNNNNRMKLLELKKIS